MFVTNEVFAAKKVGGVEDNNELIRKYKKLLKIRKLSKGLKLPKSRNSKGEKLYKSQKLANQEKNCQKVGIYLILALKRMGQVF